NNKPKTLHKLTRTKSDFLTESNKHSYNFKREKTELISFKNKKGNYLKGLLHYPDNYEKGKQYPMIVSIYEIISPQFQKYKNPSMFNENGFNKRNFTAA